MLPANLDYSDLDFDALRARMESLIRSVFPEWDDFEVANFGNLLIELFCFVGDTLSVYQDAQARESRLATATQRKSVIALARMLGYRLSGATAATATLRFQLPDGPATADVRLAAGTVIKTTEVTDPIKFQLLEDVVFEWDGLGGDIEAFGTAEHSETHNQVFDASGAADQEIWLDRAPYLDGSVIVTTQQGTWTQVENFLASTGTDRHFVVTVDQNDLATITFGDGVNGLKPIGAIGTTYKTGGGTLGLVEPNRLVVIEGNTFDTNGVPVRVTVTNPARANGGAERESIERAKIMAPLSLQQLTRCVAREDFEIAARKLPGVARALMLTSDEDASIPENSGRLYIVPTGGGVPTDALKDAVLNQVTVVYPKLLTFGVAVYPAVYREINVTCTVWFRTGIDPVQEAAAIRALLAEQFALELENGAPNPAIDFGFNVRDRDGNVVSEVAWSDVFNVIRDSAGVRKVQTGSLLLNGLSADVQLSPYEVPALGAVAIIDGQTGAVL